ncbi:MAG: NADPH-dependent F420 reductase [Chloroflexi bacterium HGW-Chloroflexi-10]|nr:MAG: NADPH-dependent F420 reductase [Chloroflexi bacterium HGW-Chloroflexi-10]
MNKKIIAILGGTGKEGKGLGYRWAKYGHTVILGSRQAEKAILAANELQELLGGNFHVKGMTNAEAAKLADVIVLTIPYSAHRDMCESIKEYAIGKMVIDVTVPLVPPKVTKVQMPLAGSATMEAKEILGDQVNVAAAFQNISYEHLFGEEKIECDVLVAGDSKNTRETVILLVENAGLVGWDAGPIENSMVLEGLTSILIGLNKKYGSHSAGIKITGLV